MAKFTKETQDIIVTVITSRNSAVGHFTYKGKYYSSQIKGRVIMPEDVESLMDSAIAMVDQLVKKARPAIAGTEL